MLSVFFLAFLGHGLAFLGEDRLATLVVGFLIGTQNTGEALALSSAETLNAKVTHSKNPKPKPKNVLHCRLEDLPSLFRV